MTILELWGLVNLVENTKDHWNATVLEKVEKTNSGYRVNGGRIITHEELNEKLQQEARAWVR